MTATTPAVDAERRQHRRVLARLRHHAVVGGDDHQEQVDARRARDHRAHEPLVPGHVDHRQPPPAGQRRAPRSRARSRCRARAPPGSRSVSMPVSARISAVLPWSMCPAVPSVSGALTARRPRARPRAAPPRPSASVRGSSSSRPSSIRPTTGGSPRAQPRGQRVRRGAGHRDRRARQLQQRQRAAAHLRRRLAPPRRPGSAPPAARRAAAQLLLGRGQHRQHGDLAAARSGSR